MHIRLYVYVHVYIDLAADNQAEAEAHPGRVRGHHSRPQETVVQLQVDTCRDFDICK